MKEVILAGSAITANILYAYLKQDSRYRVVAATVDDEFLNSSEIEELPLVGTSQLTTTFPPSTVAVIMAMGYNNLNRDRESMFVRLKEWGYVMETYVHPDARVYTEHTLGEGCAILPSAVVEPYVRLGSNTLVWCNSTLAHHASVAENCWIASGAIISGEASVMRNTFIGVNATVVNKITVSEFNIVGAAAMISKDTKPYAVSLSRSAELVRYSAEDYVRHVRI